MKANELMIGDWVEYGQYITTVRQLSDKIILSGCVGRLDEVRPVPITSGILKDNGIVLVGVGDYGVAIPKLNYYRFEKWLIHTTQGDTFLWCDRHAEYWYLDNIGAVHIHHVHELQHALRMIGLADFADNFVIKKGGFQ